MIKCTILLWLTFVQEAQVLQRVSELRRTGMWSSRRLPKVQDMPRCKAHWDYMLDEMQWLAVDFAQERQWKMAAAKQVKFRTVIYLWCECAEHGQILYVISLLWLC